MRFVVWARTYVLVQSPLQGTIVSLEMTENKLQFAGLPILVALRILIARSDSDLGWFRQLFDWHLLAVAIVFAHLDESMLRVDPAA